MKKIISSVLILFILFSGLAHGQFVDSIDPRGCRATPFTVEEWRAIGFEPLNAWGANPNDNVDDTQAIQNAMDAAVRDRRSVIGFWGTNGYIVTPREMQVNNGNGNQTFRAALHIEQAVYNRDDDRHDGNFGQRFATILKGSQCGEGRPYMRIPDGVDDDRNFADIASNPSVMLAITRRLYTATNSSTHKTQDTDNNNDPLDFTEGSRDWNQGVDGFDFITGKNSGAVAVRHMGAEGSSIKNVFIDATGGFAGLYHVSASGGYTHNVHIKGGRYGVFNEFARGGTILLNGMTLEDQTDIPLAINHYAPVTVVGGKIKHDNGPVFGVVTGGQNNYQVSSELQSTFHNSGGHVSFYETDIEITGNANQPILDNTNDNSGGDQDGQDRSVVFHNSCFKGTTSVVQNRQGGDLRLSNADDWHCVDEYAYSGATADVSGQAARFIEGEFTDNVHFNGNTVSRSSNLTLSTISGSPEDKQSKHLYDEYICNVERDGAQLITDHGAVSSDPSISGGIDNSTAINAAILAAKANGSLTVYVPRGDLIVKQQGGNSADHRLLEVFHVRDTIHLLDDVNLCGVARGTSTLSAGEVNDPTRWKPATDSPILETSDSATSTSAVMRIQFFVPNADEIEDPYVYAIDWSAGENSLVVDAWWRYDFGNPGRRVTVKINGNGGGKWYGVTQQGGYPPHQYNGAPGSDAKARRVHQSLHPYQKPVQDPPVPDRSANYIVNSDVRHMVIEGTSNPLTFYSFHCQHLIIPEGGQCDIRNSSNITFHGIKQEAASEPNDMAETVRDNPAEITPNWMTISNSSNIYLNSYETHAQYACGRGAIEIIDGSFNIVAVNLARRVGSTTCPQDQWGIIREVTDGRDSLITSQARYISMFRSETSEVETPAQITLRDLVVDENVGIANILVESDRAVDGDVVLSYRTFGSTASSGQGDIVFKQGEVTLEAGSSVATITVNILDDDIEESTEQFFVDVQSVDSGNAEVVDERSTVTINDDDVAPPVPVLTINSIFVGEGSGTANLVVRSDIEVGETITISYRTFSDEAESFSGDFEFTQGEITLNVGENARSISIPIIDDDEDEPNEAFIVEVQNVLVGNADISNAQATVTIVDNDEPAPIPNISFGSETGLYLVNEDEGLAVIDVVLDQPTIELITIEYEVVSATAASSDVDITTGEITVAAGATFGVINVGVIDDDLDEEDETFTVNLVSVSSNATLDQFNLSATVTIADNDEAPPLPVLTIQSIFVGEGSGLANIVLRSDIPVIEKVTVSYRTVSDEAESSTNDFEFTQGEVTLSIGENAKSISIPIIDDEEDEPNEAFTVEVQNVLIGNADISNTQSTITIVDNDEPATIDDDGAPSPNITPIIQLILSGE